MGYADETAREIAKSFISKMRSRNPREANSEEVWDLLWARETNDRFLPMMPVYQTILKALGKGEGRKVIDFGGGPGVLASALDHLGWDSRVIDISSRACAECADMGVRAIRLDVEEADEAHLGRLLESADVVVGTEFIEHLTSETRARLLSAVAPRPSCWSVPNNCMGPDEEPQHTIKWTPASFGEYLSKVYDRVEIRPLGMYMVALCNLGGE